METRFYAGREIEYANFSDCVQFNNMKDIAPYQKHNKTKNTVRN
jgi:hypothetical protein